MTRASSETDLRDLAAPKKTALDRIVDGFSAEEEEEEEEMERELGFRSAMTSTRSYPGCEVGARETELVSVLVGGGIGGGGGRICGGGGGGGGGGSDDGDDGSSGFWDSNRGNHSTDLFYRKMIEANPGNPLLLSNYAKFLKDVSFLVNLYGKVKKKQVIFMILCRSENLNNSFVDFGIGSWGSCESGRVLWESDIGEPK